jgi:hypothetical protein
VFVSHNIKPNSKFWIKRIKRYFIPSNKRLKLNDISYLQTKGLKEFFVILTKNDYKEKIFHTLITKGSKEICF